MRQRQVNIKYITAEFASSSLGVLLTKLGDNPLNCLSLWDRHVKITAYKTAKFSSSSLVEPLTMPTVVLVMVPIAV